jgi:rubrerythrin
MDVYDYAMQMEKDGEKLYREAANRSSHLGIGAIMTMLADAEVAHYNLFKNMKEQKGGRLPEANLLKDVKNVFVKMKEEGGLEPVGVPEIDLYRKAQDIEKKSEDFYRDSASKAEGATRESFVQVADEESKHYFILQQIIDFVSRPQQWLENAEWYHLDEY